MKISRNKLQQLLKKWQPILKLNDWDIRIQLVKASWRKSGDIKIDSEDKKAILLINEQPKSSNLNELIIHELLHLKLWTMDQMIEDLIDVVYGKKENDPKRDFAYTQFMRVLETTVEDITKGFLIATGNPESLSFGRLQKSVIDEIRGKR